MGRGRHCSEEKRNLILKLRREGKSYKFIQDLLDCSAKLISNALKWQAQTETRGRKRKTSSYEDKRLIRFVKIDPFITPSKIKDDLKLSVSNRTIRRRLQEAKLIGRSPRKMPLLQKRHIIKRLKFAREHKDWPVTKWRNILWSDESKIVLMGSSGRRVYVRRPPGLPFNPKYTLKTIKHGGSKIMVWACFSYQGVGPIVWIKTMMDQALYVDILRNSMLPYAEYEMPLKWIFMQDNDPKHTSRSAKNFFHEHQISVLEWPAQSPDLNPIENLWGDIKEAVAKARPKNNNELWQIVQTSWQAISKERCQNLVDSMPRRCNAVIKNKGYGIKY